jgi:hypothetical protein
VGSGERTGECEAVGFELDLWLWGTFGRGGGGGRGEIDSLGNG